MKTHSRCGPFYWGEVRIIRESSELDQRTVRLEEAVNTWKRIETVLETSVNPHSYLVWVRPTALSAIHRLPDGRVCWLISVPNRHFQDWWTERESLLLKAAVLAGISEDIFFQFELRTD